jgi:hypothetical protein
MRYIAIAIAVCLAVYTPLAMGGHPTFLLMQLASFGSISVFPFDVVLGLSLLALLAGNAFNFRSDPVPLNRLVVWLCVTYLGYQILVVLPAAVLFHSLRPVDVLRDQEARLGWILVLVVYGVVLVYCRPAFLVTLFDIAAAVLALVVIYRYVSTGGHGIVDMGRYLVREAWVGSLLLFGWLFLTSLFYWPMRWWRLALAILAVAGIVMSNHRSGFLALLAGFGMQMVVTGRITRRVVVSVAAIAVVGALVYWGAPSMRASASYSLRTMLSSNSDASAQDRVVRTRLGFDYFVQHPVGDYIWNQRYYLVNVWYNFPPHNFVVELLVTQGVVASLLLFSVIGVTAAIAWRNRADGTSAVMLSYMTFYLVVCAFNTTFDQYENFALLPVAIALILHQNRVLTGASPASTRAVPLLSE